MARRRLQNLPPNVAAVGPITGTAVAGSVGVPIVTVKFKDTASSPYPVSDLQPELFDGPWPTGTMSDDYREMSRGKFNVTGKVFEWIPLPQTGAFYAGPIGCSASCDQAHLGDLLTDSSRRLTIILISGNSITMVLTMCRMGDDDGFVDFAALGHPENGGECGGFNDNIWSHRFSIKDLTRTTFQTADIGAHGSNILITTTLSCPRWRATEALIQIGVFSHEFGHAFGLPDLYDTGRPPSQRRRRLGSHGLRVVGRRQQRPRSAIAHSAWAKDFWAGRPKDGHIGRKRHRTKAVDRFGRVVRVDYSNTADPRTRDTCY